jgi:cell division protein FtsA
MASMVGDGETMEVPGVGGREPQIRQRHLLCELLEPLLEDFFARVAQEIDVAGCREQLAAGVVLTGGTSNLEGIADLGMDVLIRMPVRVGRPGQAMGAESEFGGLLDVVADPAYATATGLCLSTVESASVRSARRTPWSPGSAPLIAPSGTAPLPEVQGQPS